MTRLSESRTKYGLSVTRFRKVLEEQMHLGIPAPDGSLAVRNARIQESTARNEYMRVLKIFTDLVLRGNIPDAD